MLHVELTAHLRAQKLDVEYVEASASYVKVSPGDTISIVAAKSGTTLLTEDRAVACCRVVS
jgi:hypothetical protein